MYQIYIFGMGYVGLTFGIFASSHFRVFGIENNLEAAENIKNENISIVDDGIEDSLKLALSNGSLSINNSISDIEIDRDTKTKNIFMITPGTPLDKFGNVSLDSISSIANSLIDVVKSGDLIILRSTVKVGTTSKILVDRFKKRGVHVCFCPERTLEGVAIEELKSLPQIIGANSQEDFNVARDFFESMGVSVIDNIKIEEAELSKLLCNSERDLYFALANEIALMCEELNISAANVIRSSTKNYTRSHLKIPGLVGGPCLEKDPYILKQSFPNFDFKLLTTSRIIHDSMIPSAIQRIIKIRGNANKNSKISILGCAFKGFPITADVRGSLIYKIIDELLSFFPNSDINFHDFLAKEVNLQDPNFKASSIIEDVVRDADIIILQNNHPLYKNLDWQKLKSEFNTDTLIYDFWSQLEKDSIKGLNYISLGEGTPR